MGLEGAVATQGPGKGAAPQAEATEQQDPVLIVFQAPDEPVGRCSKDPSLMLTVSPEWWARDQASRMVPHPGAGRGEWQGGPGRVFHWDMDRSFEGQRAGDFGGTVLTTPLPGCPRAHEGASLDLFEFPGSHVWPPACLTPRVLRVWASGSGLGVRSPRTLPSSAIRPPP